jgi:uncharacterized membrane protein YkoI
MMRFRILLVSIALLAAAGCASSGSGHIEPYRDVACFLRAKVSLAAAIEAAGKAHSGRVVDAEYNCDEEMGCITGNPGRYDVTFAENGRLDRVSVCAATGRVGPPFQKGGLSGLLSFDTPSWSQMEMLAGAPAIARAPVTLLAAVAVAEAAGPKAMAAHVTTAKGKTDYAVELVEHGRVHMVYVDSVSGRLRN